MGKKGSTQFNCFSPPIMVATVIIELLLAIYALYRYKLNMATRLIVITLLMLATFQISEYFVCTGSASQGINWSRLGFVAISTLPPLGIHLLHVIANKPNRRLVMSAYASMAAFIIYFLLYESAFVGHECTGNYVIFQLANKAGGFYGVYYYGWIASSLLLGSLWADNLMSRGKEASKLLHSLRALLIGWLVFLVPTAVAYAVAPETRNAIPSVMCGFAILYALILGLYLLPRVSHKRIKPKS